MGKLLLAAAAAALVGLAAAAGCSVVREQARREAVAQATATAETYLQAWQERDWQRLAEVADPPRPAVRTTRRALQTLAADDLRVEATGVDLGDERGRVPFTVSLRSRGLGGLRYDGVLELARRGDRWVVDWSPATVHPDLPDGGRLERIRRWPPRGAVRDTTGRVLAEGDDVVVVGVRGDRVADRDRVRRALVDVAGATSGEARRALRRSRRQGNRFVAATTLPRSRYEALVDRLAPVPGVFFEASERRRPRAAGVPSHVLGTVEELPAERVRELGHPYVPGDVGGVSGLEAVYERRLAGRPGGQARIVDADGDVVRVLRRWRPRAPAGIRTTLHPRVQRAADRALRGIPDPAAMVVVDAPTGAVRAVANLPGTGFDRALLGAYPPGSTFKVVTTAALLRQGVVTPATRVTCPRQAVVGGRPFGNAGGEVLGGIDFRTAFFRSCNTAFVQLADELAARDLLTAAEAFGFSDGSRFYASGLPVTRPSFPRPRDAAEQAAAAIGQGRVLASPLQLATVAAAVADGAWRPPTFIDGSPARPRRLPPGDARTLRRLMRAVVAEGTGTAAAVDEQPVGGKTGTAEYGTEQPPDTHAWFIGFRDDLALAVVVEGGGFGGEVAAPAAGRFFRATGS